MSDVGRLERHYRRLLLAYPRDFRERRAEEMLATLLDDAAEGQQKPTRRQAADLVIGGIRQRFRPPPLPTMYVAALLSALILGAFAAVVAGAIGWTTAASLPANQAATNLVASAFAPLPGAVTTRHDRLFGYDPASLAGSGPPLVTGDDTYSAGYVQIVGYPDEQQGLETAAAVLRRSGWQVGPVRQDSGDSTLTASSAHLALQARIRSDNRLIVTIYRAPPPGVAPLTVIGWIAGAVAGWLLAAAVGRRSGRQGPGVQLSMQVSTMFGLVLLAPATAMVTVGLARVVIDPASSWLSPPWGAYTFPILRPVTIVGAFFAILAAGLATVASPSPTRSAAPSGG